MILQAMFSILKRGALLLLLILLLLTIGLLIILPSSSLRSRILSQAIQLVQDSEKPILHIEHLRWDPISTLQAETATVLDAEGMWLRIEQPFLELQLHDLLQRHLHIRDLKAKSVLWHRLPRYPSSKNESHPSTALTDFTVSLDPFDPGLLHIGADIVPSGVDIHLSAALHGRNPLWRITINQFDASWTDYAFKLDEPIEAQLNGKNWNLPNTVLSGMGARLELESSSKDGAFLRGQVENLDLALFPPTKDLPVSGILQAECSFFDFLDAPTGTLHAVLASLSLPSSLEASDLPSSVELFATLQPTQLLAHAEAAGMTNGRFFAEASAPYPLSLANPHARGSLQASVPIEPFVSPYLEENQSLRGNLNAEFAFSFFGMPPLMEGTITATNLVYEDILNNILIRDANLSGRMKPDQSMIFTANARDYDKGSLTATGLWIRTESGPGETRVQARLENFSPLQLFHTALPLNGSLIMTGTGMEHRISGNLSAPSIRIRIPPRLPPGLSNIEIVDSRAATSATDNSGEADQAWPIRIQSDIQIQSGDLLRIESAAFQSDWKARIQMSGILPSPVANGTVELSRGWFRFLGRRFDLVSGSLQLAGGRGAEPYVEIIARTRVNGFDITLRISGSANSPALELSSLPPLEQNDIIARLLFGKPDESVSPLQLIYMANAIDLLEKGLPILELVGQGDEMLIFDRVDLVQREDGSGLSAVAFGRQLNDRVYFEGELGFRTEPDTFAIEAELTPNLILRTETSPRIREGISLYWRRDY